MQSTIVGHSVADRSGIILAMDDAVLAFLQRSRAEVIGKSYTAITFEEDIARNVAEVGSVAEDGPAVRLSKRYVRPDNSLVQAEVEVSRAPSPTLGTLTIGTIYTVAGRRSGREVYGLWQQARQARSYALAKAEALGGALFSDAGWLILLELYIAECEGRVPFGVGNPASVVDASLHRWLMSLQRGDLVSIDSGFPAGAELTTGGVKRVEHLLLAGSTMR